jgi:4'-phosphopantetheinyl transferase
VRGAPPAGEVHVFTLDLGPEVAVPEDGGILSRSERERAARFHRPADRARAIAARRALRVLLGAYTGAAPGSLRFAAGPSGKPALAEGPRDAPQFNVAHSGRLVLLAFARAPVGVDVEEIRGGVDAGSLARRFFSQEESAALAVAEVPERDALFFRIWTRKEAYLKALGHGLSSPLDAFTTTAADGSPPEVLKAPGDPAGFLSDLEPGAGYAGAVVTLERARTVLLPYAPP